MPIVLKSGILNLLEPSVPVQGCNGIAFTFSLLALAVQTLLLLVDNTIKRTATRHLVVSDLYCYLQYVIMPGVVMSASALHQLVRFLHLCASNKMVDCWYPVLSGNRH